MQLQKSQPNLPSPFSAAQFSYVNYFSSGFIFLLWCGRPASYVPCGQLYCSCISNCDWIEWLRLCDWVMTWMRLLYDKQLCPMTWARYKSMSSRTSRSHLSDTCSTVNIQFPLYCLMCLSIRSQRRHVLIVASIMGLHQRCRLSLFTLHYAKP
jgi:hypothetical protein